MPTRQESQLIIRQASLDDVGALKRLSQKIYGKEAYDRPELRAQINHFQQGQFVAEYDGEIVGHCATFRISGDQALKPHSWREITGNGFASRHDPKGDYLYGMEVSVDPDYRNLRIGQRLYNARKELCQYLNLSGIVFGGRLPGYGRRKRQFDGPADYVAKVEDYKARDAVVNFHLKNDFEVLGILHHYMPEDRESDGCATHMIWRNPYAPDETQSNNQPHASQPGRLPDSVRIASVQFQLRKVHSPDEFEEQIGYFVGVASSYRADFVVLPELITLALLSTETSKLRPDESMARVTAYTERYMEFMNQLAISHNINIIAGSHPTRMENGDIHNVCYVFLRDGAIHTQHKLHATPNERNTWNIKGGSRLEAIPTDCGPIGVQICYDVEFPEPSRLLADQGALILFVPFLTDERQGYLRVRYCAQARAVENQCYVALSGAVGNLPDVENMDIHYAESCVLTPCDFPFARDGVAATTAPNTEMIAFADVRMESLFLSRNAGTVQNMQDRRFDLYRVDWLKQGRR